MKKIKVKNFLIYMPSIVGGGFRAEIPTGLNARGIGVKLVFDGDFATRVVGGGVEMSNGHNHQLFRMDFGPINPAHGGGIGQAQAGELCPPWPDHPFHYHVMRY